MSQTVPLSWLGPISISPGFPPEIFNPCREVALCLSLLSRQKEVIALLQAIQDLIGPEALKALQGFVERDEVVCIHTTHLFDGIDVTLV
ncbi:hypothetical protein SAMN06265368_0861 [Cohaesibacter gelatinilyticus]|uniref:Uncharacterized protein n=1 Tax=Cohaesibacter gelatinilyticus TaxID=372072 RepID=A0A285NEM0_9HYPH|nr:hypothetical protein SAMN06265368_0861 [Cohaesibacter gelatinilyticus]